jgi:hypothetical protein
MEGNYKNIKKADSLTGREHLKKALGILEGLSAVMGKDPFVVTRDYDKIREAIGYMYSALSEFTRETIQTGSYNKIKAENPLQDYRNKTVRQINLEQSREYLKKALPLLETLLPEFETDPIEQNFARLQDAIGDIYSALNSISVL